MINSIKAACLAAIEEFARGVARLAMEQGVSVSELHHIFKRQCVVVARSMPMPDGVNPGKRYSLISTRTGLIRREVKRIIENELAPQAQGSGPKIRETLQRAERVIRGWQNDLYFQVNGRPRDLPISGDGPTFVELCRRYSGDRRHRTILQDLQRVRAVSVLEPNHRVRLERTTYAPPAGWTEEGLVAMGVQVRELLETHLHNFLHPSLAERQICVHVSNPNVPEPHGRGLAREITTQLTVVGKLLDGMLNNPDITATPDKAAGSKGAEDLQAFSVGLYMRRTQSPTGPSETPLPAPVIKAPARKQRRPQKRTTR